tara:strand:+ start:300 stop:1091 length:792 start_codon:yes stop_codon:yes gene_type:complete
MIVNGLNISTNPASGTGTKRLADEVKLYINDILSEQLYKCPPGCGLITFTEPRQICTDETHTPEECPGDLKDNPIGNKNSTICVKNDYISKGPRTSGPTESERCGEGNYEPPILGKVPNAIHSTIQKEIGLLFTTCGPKDEKNSERYCNGYDNNKNALNCYLADPEKDCNPEGEDWKECTVIEEGITYCKDFQHQSQCQQAGCAVFYDGDTMKTLTGIIEVAQDTVLNNYWIAIPILICIISIAIIAVNSFKELVLLFKPSGK